MSKNIIKKVLKNGLTIVLKEMHHAPVASFWVWYKVGSRNEIPGRTGIAHWTEHMMFKGTPSFPPGTLDKTVSREGGRWNAFTSNDYTAYYETLPADRIDLALQLESDRMINTIMSVEDVESERTVIMSERKMSENRPMFHLFEEIKAAAFRVHPYHHEVLGDQVDLETISRDDLYAFYRRNYAPNNATVVVVGDFETESMVQKIEHYFGALEISEAPDPIHRQEPAQKGERKVTVHGPGETSFLVFSYKAPAATDDDYIPLALLNSAISGGDSLGVGSSTTNKSCRLYKQLVSTQQAVGIFGGMNPTIDPYLYNIITVLPPGGDIEQLEAALNAEIERLETEPISKEELRKAVKQTKVAFIQSSESITDQARMIGMSESVMGDYQWFEEALAALDKVTLEDIERVRQKYLQPKRRIIGRYLPEIS